MMIIHVSCMCPECLRADAIAWAAREDERLKFEEAQKKWRMMVDEAWDQDLVQSIIFEGEKQGFALVQ